MTTNHRNPGLRCAGGPLGACSGMPRPSGAGATCQPRLSRCIGGCASARAAVGAVGLAGVFVGHVVMLRAGASRGARGRDRSHARGCAPRAGRPARPPAEPAPEQRRASAVVRRLDRRQLPQQRGARALPIACSRLSRVGGHAHPVACQRGRHLEVELKRVRAIEDERLLLVLRRSGEPCRTRGQIVGVAVPMQRLKLPAGRRRTRGRPRPRMSA